MKGGKFKAYHSIWYYDVAQPKDYILQVRAEPPLIQPFESPIPKPHCSALTYKVDLCTREPLINPDAVYSNNNSKHFPHVGYRRIQLTEHFKMSKVPQ